MAARTGVRRRRSAMVLLAAAVAPVVSLGLARPAAGESKTFTATASDWLDPANWTPTGVPGAADDVLITSGGANMSLGGDLTIGRIIYSNIDNRILGNGASTDEDSILTLTGSSSAPLIDVTSAATFTLTGANIDPNGAGSGRMSVKVWTQDQLLNLHVADAGSLILNADVDEVGGSHALTKTGEGELSVRRALNVSGALTVDSGTLRLSGSNGRMLFSEDIAFGAARGTSARLILDNSTGVRNDRINDNADVVMYGGSSIEMIGGPAASSERGGFVHLTSVGGDFSMRISGGGFAHLTWVGLDRDVSARGVLNLEASVGSNIVFQTPPPMINGIVGDWAIFNGDNWAKIDALSGEMQAYTDYTTSGPGTWTRSSNVLASGSLPTVVSSSTTINTLKMTGTTTISVTGQNFFGVGGIIASGAGNTITGDVTVRIRPRDQFDTGAALNIITPGPASTLHVARPIGDIGTQLDLVKSGAGRLVLGADNPFAGTVYVNGGTLKLGAAGQLGRAGLEVGRDALLELEGSLKTIGGLSGSGNVLLGSSTLSIGKSDASTTYGGVISGTGGITKIGRGKLTLTGDNTYSGTTTIAGGTLEVTKFSNLAGTSNVVIVGDSDGDLRLGNGVTLPQSLPVTLAGGGGAISVLSGNTAHVNVGINETLPFATLHKRGGGTLEMHGASAYTGDTIIERGTMLLRGADGALWVGTTDHGIAGLHSGGTLVFDNTAGVNPDRIPDAVPIVMNGGGSVELRGGSEREGLVRLTSVGGDFHISNIGGSSLTWVGLDRHSSATGTLNLRATVGSNIVFENPPAMVNGIIGDWAIYNGTDWAAVGSDGVVHAYDAYALSGPATWTTNDNVRVDGSTVTLVFDRDANTAKLTGGASISVSGTHFFNTRGIVVEGSGPGGVFSSISGAGSITATPRAGQSNTLRTIVDLDSQLTIGASITDNSAGPVSLVVSGGGTVVLSGNNTNTGSTKVSKAVLKTFFQAGDRPTQGQFRLSNGGTLDITAHDQTIGSLSGDGFVVLGGNTLTVGGNDKSGVFSGSIASTTGGGLTKVGTGTLTLSGEPMFNGELHVSNGRMRLDALEDRLKTFGLLSSMRLGSSTTQGVLELDGGSAGDVIDLPPTVVEGGGGRLNKVSLYIRNVRVSSLSGSGPFIDEGGVSDYVAPIQSSGAMTVKGSIVNINRSGMLMNVPSVSVTDGGSLVLVKDSNADAGNRVKDTASIEMYGGKVLAIQSGTAPTTETMGTLKLKQYDSTIAYQAGDTAIYNGMIYQATEFSGGMVNFVFEGNSHLLFNSSPTLSNGILDPGARFHGSDYATVNAATGEVVAYSGYEMDQDPSHWTAGDNVDLTGDVTIASNTTINTLRSGPAAVARAAGLQHGAFLATNGILAANDGDSITGDGKLTSQGPGEIKVVVDRDTGFTIGVPVVDSSGGATTLAKGGAGTLLLNATSTHSGDTIVGAGTLKVGVGVNLPNSVLDIGGNAERVEFLGASTIAGLSSSKPRIPVFCPPISDSSITVGIAGARSTTFAGDLTGVGGLTKAGDSTLTLTGENTYHGQTIVDGGTLVLTDDASLANTSFVRIKRDLLIEKERKGLHINPDATIELDGGHLEVSNAHRGDFDPIVETLGPLQFRRGASVRSDDGLVFNVVNPREARSTIGFETSGNGSIGFENAPALSTAGIIGPWARFSSGPGCDFATIDSGGNVTAFDNYHANPDTTTWDASKVIHLSGGTALQGTTGAAALKLIGGAQIDLHGHVLETTGFLATSEIGNPLEPILLYDSTASVGGGDGAITAPSGTQELHFTVVDRESDPVDTIVQWRIADNGAPVDLVKSGNGTLTLNARNTYTGQTVINEGEVAMGQFASLLDSTVNFADDYALLGLKGYDNAIGGLTGEGGTVHLDPGSVLTIAQSADTSFGGTIAGSGRVVKRQGGKIALGTDWTYSGSAVIEKGTLELGGGASLPNVTEIEVGGTFKILPRVVPISPVNSSATLRLTGGIVDLAADLTDDPPAVTMGAMIMQSNGSLVRAASEFNLLKMESRAPSSTISFQTSGDGKISFIQSPTLSNGIVGPWARFSSGPGFDWATINPAGEVVGYTGYETSVDPADWAAADNVSLNASVTISGNKEVSTLKLQPLGGDLVVHSDSTLQTDGILAFTGAHGTSISGFEPITSTVGRQQIFVSVDVQEETPVANAGGLRIAKPIADNGAAVSLVKTGEGTVTLDATNTYTGGTFINNGKLKLSVNGFWAFDSAMHIAAPGTLDLNGQAATVSQLSGEGAVDLGSGGSLTVNQATNTTFNVMRGDGDVIKRGAGTLTLSGDSTHTGEMVVENGTLEVGGALSGTSKVRTLKKGELLLSFNPKTANRINDSAQVEMHGGTVRFIVGNDAPAIENVGVLHLAAGASEIVVSAPPSGSATLRFSALESADRGKNLNWDFQGGGSLQFASPPAMSNGIVGGWMTTRSQDDGTIKTFTWIDSTGKVQPFTNYVDNPASWSATSNGRYVLRAGIPLRFDTNALQIVGDGSGLPSTLTLDSGASIITSGGIIATGTSGHAINGVGTLTSGGDEMFVHVLDANDTFTIGVPITNNSGGAVSLVKAGDGRLVLEAPPTYTGATIINRGELKTKFQDGDIPTGTDFVIGAGGTLDISDGNQRIGSLAGDGRVVLGGSTLTAGANEASTAYAGVMSGSGGFTKAGTGSLTLSGVSTYSGQTIIGDGELVFQSGGSLPNTSMIAARGGMQVDSNFHISSTTPIHLEGGTLTVILNGNVVIGDIVANSGASTVKPVFQPGTPGTYVFSLSVSRSAGSGATVDFEVTDDAPVQVATPVPMTNGIIGGWATVSVNGIDNWETSDWAIFDGGRIKPLANYQTAASPGAWTASDNVSIDGPRTLSGDKTINTLRTKEAHSSLALGGHVIQARGLLVTDDDCSIVGPGTITSPTGEFFVAVPDRARSRLVLVSGSVGDSSKIVLSGGGILQLDANNPTSGDVFINDGTLQLGEFGELPNATVRTSATGPGVFNPAAWTKIVGAIAGDGPITLGSNTLTVGNNGQSTSYGGVISGAGSLVKIGDGTLTLHGDTQYTGETVVAGGTLDVGGGASLRGTTRLDFGQAKIRRPRDLADGRMSNSAPFEMGGGVLEVVGDSVPWTEEAGVLRMLRNNNVITAKTTPGESGGAIRFAGADFEGRALGTTAQFNVDTAGGNGQVIFAAAPALTNGIIGPWAIVNGTDWAATQICPGGSRVWPVQGYWENSDSSTWDATKNVGLHVGTVVGGGDANANTLRFGASAGGPGGGSGGSILIEAPSVLRTDGILVTAPGGGISGPGALTAKAGGPSIWIIVTDAGFDFAVSAPIIDNGSPVNLIKSGAGTVSLNAAAAHSGTTIVNEGTLAIGAAGSLSLSTADINRDGKLDVLAGSAPAQIGGLSGSGELALARGIIIVRGSGGTAADHTYSGRITGSGSFTKADDGVLTLTGASTYSGAMIVDGGELVLRGSGAALTNTSGITLRTRLTTYDDDDPNVGRMPATAPLHMEAGQLEVMFGSGLGKTDVFGILHAARGGSVVTTSQVAGFDIGSKVVFSSLTSSPGATLDMQIGANTKVTFTSPPAMTNGIVGAYAVHNSSNWAKIDNTDSSVAPYTSYLTSSNSSTWLTSSNVLVSSSSVVLTGDRNPNTLKMLNTASVANNGWHLRTNGILAVGDSASINGTGTLTAKIGSSELFVHVPGSSSTLTINNSITNNGGPVSLVKAGAGTLVMGTSSSHSGITYVNQGTLRLEQFANMIDSSLNLEDDGIVDYAGHTATIGGLSGSGAVTLGTGGVMQLSQDGSTVYSGAISGAGGSIIKSGSGTLALTGVSTYSGPTTIVQGTLEVSSAAALGDDSATNNIVLAGGTLRASGSFIKIRDVDAAPDDSTIDANGFNIGFGAITGEGALTLDGGARLMTPRIRGEALHVHVKSNPHGVTKAQVGLGNADNTATSRIQSLTIDPAAVVDLTSGALITEDPLGTATYDPINGAYVYDGVLGMVQRGRGEGLWDGVGGIVTSMTDATTSVITGLAVSSGAEMRGLSPGQTELWRGETITSDSTVVFYTWGGDADLNGELTGDDYFRIDSNILLSGFVFGYGNGDFDLNGFINGDDYFIIDSNITFAQNSPPFPTGSGGALAAVPEPAEMSAIIALGAMLGRRRRRA